MIVPLKTKAQVQLGHWPLYSLPVVIIHLCQKYSLFFAKLLKLQFLRVWQRSIFPSEIAFLL